MRLRGAGARATLQIERLSKLGEGVAHLDGRTVFVDGALPGEKVLAEVSSSGKVLRAAVVELLEKSPARREPACPLASRCGGCDWLHPPWRTQRDAKEEIVLSALEHLGGIERSSFERWPTVVSPNAMGYRRRAVLHWGGGRLGFYGKKSHEHVAVDACPALTDALEKLPGRLSQALSDIAKDVETVTLLAEGDAAALSICLKESLKERHAELAERTVRELGLRGAVLVPREGPVTLVGKPVLKARSPLHPEVPLFHRPDAFAQANAEANVGLVGSAVTMLGATESDRVLELYSGVGNFTFAIAGTAASVLGVESSPAAVELARRAAREGNVLNVRFVQGDVPKVARGLSDGKESFDLLLLDPPRTGATGVAEWARRLQVRRVVYVACDPASLARDGAALVSAGFRPRALQLVDMFPQTRHVEAVMSFDRA